MLKTVIFYGIVIAAPLAMILYFLMEVTTLAVVHNTGSTDTPISLVIDNGHGFERTPDKLAKAKAYTLVMFTPQTEGALAITCKKDGHWQGFALGPASPKTFFASWVNLQSCDRLVSKKVYSF